MQSTGHTDTQLASLQHLWVITKAKAKTPISGRPLAAYPVATVESTRRSCPLRPSTVAIDRRLQPGVNAAPLPPDQRGVHRMRSSTGCHEVEKGPTPVSHLPDSSYRLHLRRWVRDP
jgi:hypothetical protein